MSLEPMIDPDCRDPYKHGTCAGAPCQCPCHGTTPPVAAGPALPGG